MCAGWRRTCLASAAGSVSLLLNKAHQWQVAWRPWAHLSLLPTPLSATHKYPTQAWISGWVPHHPLAYLHCSLRRKSNGSHFGDQNEECISWPQVCILQNFLILHLPWILCSPSDPAQIPPTSKTRNSALSRVSYPCRILLFSLYWCELTNSWHSRKSPIAYTLSLGSCFPILWPEAGSTHFLVLEELSEYSHSDVNKLWSVLWKNNFYLTQETIKTFVSAEWSKHLMNLNIVWSLVAPEKQSHIHTHGQTYTHVVPRGKPTI